MNPCRCLFFANSHRSSLLWACVCLAFFFCAASCGDPAKREAVEDTVQELTGKKQLDRMKQMKKSVDRFQKQQAQRFQHVDDANR